jgi:hypothetical protein
MPDLSIHLPEELGDRLSQALTLFEMNAQQFIALAITEKLASMLPLNDASAEDDRRFAAFLKDGKSVPWSEMEHYLECRLRGETVPLPAARDFQA